MDIIKDIAWHSTLIFLWIGSVVALLVGTGMLFAPDRTWKISEFFGRWIDTHSVEERLDRPRWMERHIYRHHRVAGALLTAGSVFVVYRFLFRPSKHVHFLLSGNDFGWLGDAVIALFVIGAVLGAFLGVVMMTRPSALRELEVACNQWVSTEKYHAGFNKTFFPIDSFVQKYRKVVALILIGGGAYIFLILGASLLNGNWRI